jgi:hypothetical protein
MLHWDFRFIGSLHAQFYSSAKLRNFGDQPIRAVAEGDATIQSDLAILNDDGVENLQTGALR